MENIEISSLPKIKFALSYCSDTYANFLPKEPDFIEITYVAEGSIKIEQEGITEIAQKGDVICNLFSADRRFVSDVFQEHHTVGAFVSWNENSEALYGLTLPVVTKADKNISSLHRIIDELICNAYFYKNAPANGGQKFLALLCGISNYNQRQSSSQRSSDRVYTLRAKEFINQNLYRPISLKEVADHLSITPEYLCAVFKKCEGVSLIKYANTVKLQGVKTLMEKEGLRLYEAATHFGYSDPNYASRLYRKIFGVNITK